MNVVVLNTALALAERGHHVDLVTRRSDPSAPAQVPVADGVTLHHLDAGPARRVSKAEHEDLIHLFSSALRGWVRERQGTDAAPDLLHSEHWFSGVAALPVAHEFGLPHLQSFHSVAAPGGAPLDLGEPPESAGRNAGEQLCARESALIVAVSEAEKTTVVERLGAAPERVVVVSPGVDTEQFHPEEPTATSHENSDSDSIPRPYLLFAARLEELKGADLAVRTLASLPEEQRPTLVIAGEASPDFAWYARQLDELTTSLGLTDRVRHVGTQDRPSLARLLRGAALLLNPSRSETYGLINLEAAASGTPVVAASAGGMVESVRDGETGILLTRRDPRVWAKAVGHLLRDTTERARMGAAARAFAREHTWAQVALETERVYEAALTA
jgi:D-inositol-3-phosphate glycosyltransferase